MTARRPAHKADARARAARAAWQPRLEYPEILPVSARRDDIAAAIRAHPVVIVAGDTGSGKTTQIPKICLELGRGIDGQIALTQPRRLAAHAVAQRLATETDLPERDGIGVHVRFDDRSAPSARIRVMTDGILLAQTARDPQFRAYDTVIVDEAHERSLNVDFLLGCLSRALEQRDDLRVIVTSATINTAAFSRFFADAPVIDVEGRTYPVEIVHRPVGDGDELTDAVHASAVELLERLPDGDILVFLPGEREIHDVQKHLRRRQCAPAVRACEVVPVYGRLPDADQRAVFRPGPARRILLATNVAETSLTLPRIRGVIDSGLVRISRYSARSKIQRLATEQVSQASARQRAGRCGRIAPGVCIRLYTEDHLDTQPAFTDPEVLRTDLASVTLRMLDAGLGEVESFPWLDAPDTKRVRDAVRTLRELGAVDDAGHLRRTGRRIARLSVDPRLGRVLLEAVRLGVLDAGLIVVAALAVGDPRLRPADRRDAADAAHAAYAGERADFEAYLAIWDEWHTLKGGQRKWMVERFLSPRRMFDWRDVQRQLARQCGDIRGLRPASQAPHDRIAALTRAFIAGFGTQAARRDADGNYTGPRNTRLALHPSSALAKRRPAWVIGLEFVRTRELYLRDVIAVKPKWLMAGLRHLVTRQVSEPYWDTERRQALAVVTTLLDGLVLGIDRTAALEREDPALARELMIRHTIVRDEAELDLPFMDAYRDRLAQIAADEGRARRVLLYGETARERWFAERLPPTLIGVRDLAAWLDAEPDGNDRLTPAVDDLAELAETSPDRPAFAELGGQRVALSYRYAPGDRSDGVSLELPAALAARVRRSDIDAAVPALLHERIDLYLRKLPKSARTRLHPIAESARAYAERLADSPDDLPFGDRLRLILCADLGLDDSAFARWGEVDDAHLAPCVDVLPGLVDAAATPPEVPSFDWRFGTLPALTGEPPFVALAVVGATGVVRRDFRQRATAEESHAAAVLAMLAHAARSPLSLCGELLRERPFIAIRLRDRVDTEQLEERIGRLAIDAVADPETRLAARDRAGFVALADKTRGCVADALSGIVDELGALADQLADAARRLSGAALPDEVASDIDAQLAALVPCQFPEGLNYNNFNNLGRYIRAVCYRVDKYSTRASRDREAMATVRRLARRLDELPASVAREPAAREYRWALEELRVSLFAEPLGTAFKVSPKRLERLWQKVLAR